VKIGLEGETIVTSNLVATRAALDPRDVGETVEFADGEYRWRVAKAHADFLRFHPVDWLNLTDSEYATRVKRNSRRDVWRVQLDDRADFAKL